MATIAVFVEIAKEYFGEATNLMKCAVRFGCAHHWLVRNHRASSMPGMHHLLLLYHICPARQPVRHGGSRGVAVV